jgi:hypothetical protein
VFERLDWRPFGIRSLLPIAATQPPGEASRLDSFRADLTRELLERLSLADGDAGLAEALDRWEISLFQDEPVRSEQLRAALLALLGDTYELRAAVLVGREADERRRVHESLRAWGGRSDVGGAAVGDVLRRGIVAVLRHGERERLLRELDGVLLGSVGGRSAAALTG